MSRAACFIILHLSLLWTFQEMIFLPSNKYVNYPFHNPILLKSGKLNPAKSLGHLNVRDLTYP